MFLPRTLVIGYGSIGARHTRLLTDMGCKVAVVSSRVVDVSNRYSSLDQALRQFEPEYIVIANQTYRHLSTLEQLASSGFPGKVLVEKPIFDRVFRIPKHTFSDIRVAYNLRFHPVLDRLRTLLQGQRICSISAYVGQYLPDWRPDIDYRKSYSAYADQGGGVLLDLSHDLDYLCWISGAWTRVAAIGGRFGTLEISSDDTFTLLFETERCPALSIQLNYLDRKGRRFVIINTDDNTYEADLTEHVLRVNSEVHSFPVGRDTTYQAMHQAMVSGQSNFVCSLEEGLAAVGLIEAARKAADQKIWVNR